MAPPNASHHPAHAPHVYPLSQRVEKIGEVPGFGEDPGAYDPPDLPQSLNVPH